MVVSPEVARPRGALAVGAVMRIRDRGMAVDAVVLRREARSLRSALVGADAEVRVALSRETAEFVARMVEARADGREVIVTHSAEDNCVAGFACHRPSDSRTLAAGRLLRRWRTN
jgi:hypothetical protein